MYKKKKETCSNASFFYFKGLGWILGLSFQVLDYFKPCCYWFESLWFLFIHFHLLYTWLQAVEFSLFLVWLECTFHYKKKEIIYFSRSFYLLVFFPTFIFDIKEKHLSMFPFIFAFDKSVLCFLVCGPNFRCFFLGFSSFFSQIWVYTLVSLRQTKYICTFSQLKSAQDSKFPF